VDRYRSEQGGHRPEYHRRNTRPAEGGTRGAAISDRCHDAQQKRGYVRGGDQDTQRADQALTELDMRTVVQGRQWIAYSVTDDDLFAGQEPGQKQPDELQNDHSLTSSHITVTRILLQLYVPLKWVLVASRTVAGLRERKKKLTRQLLTDTATKMFVRDGFDGVRVVDVAAACGVSEKTVYNYFPTKEALILDRFQDIEADVRNAFGSDRTSESPLEIVVGVILTETTSTLEGISSSSADPVQTRRFVELMQEAPALRAAHWEI